MCNQHFLGRKEVLLCVASLALFLFLGKAAYSLPIGGEDPMEGRKEKLKIFREKRDLFFKEDPRSPLGEADRKKFRGLPYYPIDLEYARVGVIEQYPNSQRSVYVNLPTNKGRDRRYVKYGRFKFEWAGKGYLLEVYRPLGGGELFLPFRDRTSGTETHPGGRYLPIEAISGGRVLIDFNRAYNPFCEYSQKYTCPYATEENRLDIPIPAGEKRFR